MTLFKANEKIPRRARRALVGIGLSAAATVCLGVGPASAQIDDLVAIEPELAIETTEHYHNHDGSIHAHSHEGEHSHNDAVDQATHDDLLELKELTLISHAIAQTAEETSSGLDSLFNLTESSANSQASGGGIFITFDSANPAPADVQAVATAAINQIDGLITTKTGGPVEVLFSWQNLGGNNILGFGGPETLYQGSSLPTNRTYPAALVNTILNVDQNGAARPELLITLNSQLYTSNSWHLSTSNTSVPNSKIDLYSVVLHEAIHGLGFTGSAADYGSGPELGSPLGIYDDLVRYNNQNLTALSNPNQYLESNALDVTIGGGEIYKLYDPTNWENGSSYSHFDESVYGSGAPGTLMTPLFNYGVANRSVDAPILGILDGIGWGLQTTHLKGNITSLTKTSNSVTVKWNFDLSQVGSLPNTMQVKVKKDGVLVKQVTTSPAAKSATVTGLSASTNYSLELRSVGDATDSTRVTSFTTSASGSSGSSGGGSSSVINVNKTALDGQIGRLYSAYFLRQPDSTGLNYWKTERVNGTSPDNISSFFASSQEFASRYGNLSNAQFVDLVYANVLRREPDAGYNYWLGLLNSGTSRGSVMLGFAESSEYITRTETVAPNSEIDGQILRIYKATFLRTPTDQALDYWVSVLVSTGDLQSIANEFTTSPEFASRYGSLSNPDFTKLIYQNVLKRTPSSSEVNYWSGLLDAGLSRGEMLTGFSEGFEFRYTTGIL